MVRPWPSPVGAQHVSAAFLKHPPARTIGPKSLAVPRRPTLLHFAGAAFALPRSSVMGISYVHRCHTLLDPYIRNDNTPRGATLSPVVLALSDRLRADFHSGVNFRFTAF